MAGTRHIRRHATVLAALALTSACSGSGEPAPPAAAPTPVTTAAPSTLPVPAPTPVPSPTTTPAPPSTRATTTTTPAPPPLVDLDAVDDFSEWQLVVDAAESFGPVAAFDGTVLVGNQPDDGDAVTIQEPGGVAATVHRPPTDWILDDAELANGRVVVGQFENRNGDYEIWSYEVADGTGTLVEEWAGEPVRHSTPHISLDGDRLAWNSTAADGTTCIRVRDLATGDQYDAVCSSGPDEVLSRPLLSWPTLTYRADPVDGEPCPTLFAKELPDGPVMPLPQRRDCRGFQGAVVDGTAVWFEMPLGSPNAFRTSIIGTGGDGTLYDLGVGAAGSIRACAGRIFWVSELRDHNEIRTWAAGEPLRTLYRSPQDKFPTTAPSCANGWLTIARSFTGAGPSTLDVLTARVG